MCGTVGSSRLVLSAWGAQQDGIMNASREFGFLWRDIPRGGGERGQAVWGASDVTSNAGGVGQTARIKAEL